METIKLMLRQVNNNITSEKAEVPLRISAFYTIYKGIQFFSDFFSFT
jgi:hypothetical protein